MRAEKIKEKERKKRNKKAELKKKQIEQKTKWKKMVDRGMVAGGKESKNERAAACVWKFEETEVETQMRVWLHLF